MTASRETALRVSCPSCGGSIKAPAGQRGQRFQCPRCDAEVVAPGGPGEEARAAGTSQGMASHSQAAIADDDLPQLAVPAQSGPSQRRAGRENLIFLRCPLCKTLIEADERKLGQTVLCPECTSPVTVARPAEPPPKPPVDRSPSNSGGDEDVTMEAPGEVSPYHVLLPPELRGAKKSSGTSAAEPAALRVPPRPRQYSVVCPLCGTRLDATEDKVGQDMKCPDCHKIFAVPPPPPTAAALSDMHVSAGDEDTEFRLSETFERPKYQPLVLGAIREEDMPLLSGTATDRPVAQTVVACPNCGQHVFTTDEQLGQTMVCSACKAEVPVEKIASVAAPSRGSGAGRAAETGGHDALQRAAQEHAEREAAQPKLPAQPLITGVMDFLKDSEAILRLIVLGALFSLECFLAMGAIRWANDPSGILQFAAVACSILGAIFGLITVSTAAVSYLAIIEESAHGADRITSWPDWNFLDWISLVPFVVVSALLSALPGVLLSALLDLVGAPAGLSAFMMVLSVYICYPVIQLAALEADSALLPISEPVWKSLKTCAWHWWTLYGLSSVIFMGGIALLILLFTSLPGKSLIVGFGLAFLTMLYYRLLGRLAWACQEQYSLEDDEEEEAA